MQSRYPFEVDAICLYRITSIASWRMPEGDDDFSKRWMSIKAIFSKRYLSLGGQEGLRNKSRKKRGEAAIWQRRYWEHLIHDEEDYTKHFDYTHFNPVKHGYVDNPCKWQWSSFHRYVKLGYYEENWGVAELVTDDNLDFGE